MNRLKSPSKPGKFSENSQYLRVIPKGKTAQLFTVYIVGEIQGNFPKSIKIKGLRVDKTPKCGIIEA